MKPPSRVFVILALFGFVITTHAQSSADIDTFRIDNIPFVVQGEVDWFSSMLHDSIQADTNWNYQLRYAPVSNPRNTTAIIGIQIIQNTHYVPTKKEERKFKKQCTVTEVTVDRFNGYYLFYEPQKIKGCRKCMPLFTQVYSFALNGCYVLNIVFQGQGSASSMDTLQSTFQKIANNFVIRNSNALYAFSNIDINSSYTKDTLNVQDYYINTLIPAQFTPTKRRNGISSELSLAFSNTCIDPFSLSLKASIYDTSELDNQVPAFSIADTAISVLRPKSSNTDKGFSLYEPKSEYTISTKRMIPIVPGKYIVITISTVQTINSDLRLSYYSDIVRKYADMIAAVNPTALNKAAYIKVAPLEMHPKKDLLNIPKIDLKSPAKPK